MRDKFRRFFWTTPIGLIAGIPMMIGLALMPLIFVFDLKQIEPIILFLGFFFFGGSAIPMIIRKEGIGFLRGKLLIIYAYSLLIIFWTIALIFLIIGYLP